MAVDTRSKRASSVQTLAPYNLALVLPDGTIGQPDRQHIVWVYSGIASSILSATPADRIYWIGQEARLYPVEQEARTYPVIQETRTYPVE